MLENAFYEAFIVSGDVIKSSRDNEFQNDDSFRRLLSAR